jgi:quercetin dioxygenase-like cupin family protein/catechol 2,3-dioxygenase-like lactoylglutathione lyase family enzyme
VYAEKKRIFTSPDDGVRLPTLDMVHKVTSESSGGSLTVEEWGLPPGMMIPPHTHTREDECNFVLEGELTCDVGGEIVVAPKGSYVLKPRGVPHALYNAGPEPVRMLEILTPGGFEGYFDEYERIASSTMDGDERRKARAELGERYGVMWHDERISEVEARFGIGSQIFSDDSPRIGGKTAMNETNAQHIPNVSEMDEWEAKLSLLNDIHHLTFVTSDMDRLIAFYERVFGARVTVDLEKEGVRHAFIEVGPHTVLHPFQVPGVDPPGPQPMIGRGRLDHFALNAASEEAFRKLRRRIVAEGASDSEVTDMGSMLLFSFLDPDEGRHEVVWRKPGVPAEAGLRRAEWRTVELR